MPRESKSQVSETTGTQMGGFRRVGATRNHQFEGIFHYKPPIVGCPFKETPISGFGLHVPQPPAMLHRRVPNMGRYIYRYIHILAGPFETPILAGHPLVIHHGYNDEKQNHQWVMFIHLSQLSTITLW